MPSFRHSFVNVKHIARYFAKIALKALYDEVSLYPKPGLVSFVDNGAHQDMNGALFLRSLFALRHYFYSIALHSALGARPSQLVGLGLEAEKRMFQVTRGINTHRGAIFSIGILCSSIARLSATKTSFSMFEIQQTIIKDWAFYLTNDHKTGSTHGALVQKKHQVFDAKHLAIIGYEPVFDVFYDILEVSANDKTWFGLLAYKHLLLRIDDLNVLYRTGLSGLMFARDCIYNAIRSHERQSSILRAIELHRVFIDNNISPGGVADMIGFLYFLHRVFIGDLQ